MFCPNCGKELPNDSAFCPNCGAAQPLRQSAEPPVDQAPPAGQRIPGQPAFQLGAQPVAQQTYHEPWHSRGKLSPLYPGAKKVSIRMAVALTALQTVLFLLFLVVAGFADAGPVTAQIVGFIPTAALIVYLFCLDTIEKEPPMLLLKLFLVEGVLTMLVVAYVEIVLEVVVSLFAEEGTLLFHILDNLICVALVEEGFKFAVLKLFTWKHPAFNYRFDGIVYAAVTALGFAAFENFSYVASYGFGTALTRMVSAVPGHCVDGILMGIFYSKAKLLEGQGDRAGARRNLFLALLAPIAEHGFYDFFANIGESMLANVVFYAYVFILNAVVFVLVWRLAQKDEAIYAQQPEYAAQP